MNRLILAILLMPALVSAEAVYRESVNGAGVSSTNSIMLVVMNDDCAAEYAVYLFVNMAPKKHDIWEDVSYWVDDGPTRIREALVDVKDDGYTYAWGDDPMLEREMRLGGVLRIRLPVPGGHISEDYDLTGFNRIMDKVKSGCR
jgi:hypothetical protein